MTNPLDYKGLLSDAPPEIIALHKSLPSYDKLKDIPLDKITMRSIEKFEFATRIAHTVHYRVNQPMPTIGNDEIFVGIEDLYSNHLVNPEKMDDEDKRFVHLDAESYEFFEEEWEPANTSETDFYLARQSATKVWERATGLHILEEYNWYTEAGLHIKSGANPEGEPTLTIPPGDWDFTIVGKTSPTYHLRTTWTNGYDYPRANPQVEVEAWNPGGYYNEAFFAWALQSGTKPHSFGKVIKMTYVESYLPLTVSEADLPVTVLKDDIATMKSLTRNQKMHQECFYTDETNPHHTEDVNFIPLPCDPSFDAYEVLDENSENIGYCIVLA